MSEQIAKFAYIDNLYCDRTDSHHSGGQQVREGEQQRIQKRMKQK